MSLEVENFCDIRRPYITFILYEGDQYFWKNKTSIHLTIAEHTSEYLPGIVEIIAYDPILREEAPRLYVSLSEMEDCIDQSKIDVRLQIAVDKASTGSETIDERLLRQQVIRDLKVDYLLTRISINSKNHNNVDKLRNLIEDRRSDNEWTISLIAHFHDQKDDLGQLTLLCSLPRLLTPLRVHRDSEKKQKWLLIAKLFKKYARDVAAEKKARRRSTKRDKQLKRADSSISHASVDDSGLNVKRSFMKSDGLQGDIITSSLSRQGSHLSKLIAGVNELTPVHGACDTTELSAEHPVEESPNESRRISIHDVLALAREYVDKDERDQMNLHGRSPLYHSAPVSACGSPCELSDSSSEGIKVEKTIANRLLPLIPRSRGGSDREDNDSTHSSPDKGHRVFFGESHSNNDSGNSSPVTLQSNALAPVGILMRGASSRGHETPPLPSTPNQQFRHRTTAGSNETSIPRMVRQSSRVSPAATHLSPSALENSGHFLSPMGIAIPTPSQDEDHSAHSTNDVSVETGNSTPKPRTFAKFNAAYYYNQNSQHEKSYHSYLQRMHSQASQMHLPRAGDNGADDHDYDHHVDVDCQLADDENDDDEEEESVKSRHKMFDTSALHEIHLSREPSPFLDRNCHLHDDHQNLITGDTKHRLRNYVKEVIRQARETSHSPSHQQY